MKFTTNEDINSATLKDRVDDHKIEVGDYIGNLKVDWICEHCNAGNTELRPNCRRCYKKPKFHPNLMF